MKFQQNIFLENGGQLLLPPNPDMLNTNIPDLLAWDAVKQYPLTTKYRWFGKTYVYARAVDYSAATGGRYINSQLQAFRAAVSASIIAIDFSTTNVHSHDAGVSTIIVEASSITKDKWKYGYVMLGAEAEAASQFRSIVGNSATYTLAATSVVDVELDLPLSYRTLHDTTTLGLYVSQYAEVEWAGQEYQWASHVGVPLVRRGGVGLGALNGQWFWLQTWGPCWIQPGAGSTIGDNADERALLFDGQGQIAIAGSSNRKQSAGFVIPKTMSTDDSYSATPQHLVMLQIDP